MQFDFGENWNNFSKHALTDKKVAQARNDFGTLFDKVPLNGRSFLDIGFGQGLSLLIAAENGARTVGNDINPKCVRILRTNGVFFKQVQLDAIPVRVGSILDPEMIDELRRLSPDAAGFDVVHSWGVLHHTGDMNLAIKHVSSLIRPGGHLILALYNRHWTSPFWWWIKRLYCASPSLLQRMMIAAFYPTIWVAKLLATRQNPKHQVRGMDFYYNVVDWVGGYPYEYATVEEVDQSLAALGLKPVKVITSKVPTGCNEFVYQIPA